MFGCRYKKYPLEFRGDPINGIQYFLTIYSGGKALRMLIDSGACISLIGNIHLKGCSYTNIPHKQTLLGVSGEMQAKNILFDFDLEKPCGSNTPKYNQLFAIAFKKDNLMINSDDEDGCAGVLGSTFLQFCDINLREGYIKVYNKAGYVTKSLRQQE